MYGCPGCGSVMTFSVQDQALKCGSCGRTQSIEEADQREARTAGSSFSVDLLTCPTCGAEIRAMNTAQAAFCSYCGSSVMLERRETDMEAPETVAPFRVTREECFQKYQQMVRKSLCADHRLKKQVTAESFRGIYVPHYIFSASVKGQTNLEATQTVGDDTYYYNTTVQLDHSFTHILHDASREMPDAMSEKIARVDAEAFRPFSPAYLSGFYSDIPDTKENAYLPFAKAEAVRLGLEDALKDLKGQYQYSTAEAEKKLIKLADAECTGQTLVPVWFMSVRSGNRLLYAIQNGVTGEMVADLPMDIPRFAGIALIAAIPLFFLFNTFLTLRPDMVLIAAMLLALGAQWIIGRRQYSIRNRENREEAKDGRDDLKQRLKQRKKLARHARGSATGFFEGLGSFGLMILLCFGLSQLAKLNNASVTKAVTFALTAGMGGLIFWGSRSGVRTPMGCLAALGVMVLATLNLLLDPFRSGDTAVYVLTVLCLACVIWVCVDLLLLHNRECSNPLPQFESHQGGDDRA